MQAVKADSLQNYSERFVGSIPAWRAKLIGVWCNGTA